MVSQQAWFAAEMARRFGGHPAVVAWLVSNEMPIYGGPGTDRRGHFLGPVDSPSHSVRRGDTADLNWRRRLGDGGFW